jgi:hypothetical protein
VVLKLTAAHPQIPAKHTTLIPSKVEIVPFEPRLREHFYRPSSHHDDGDT